MRPPASNPPHPQSASTFASRFFRAQRSVLLNSHRPVSIPDFPAPATELCRHRASATLLASELSRVVCSQSPIRNVSSNNGTSTQSIHPCCTSPYACLHCVTLHINNLVSISVLTVDLYPLLGKIHINRRKHQYLFHLHSSTEFVTRVEAKGW